MCPPKRWQKYTTFTCLLVRRALQHCWCGFDHQTHWQSHASHVKTKKKQDRFTTCFKTSSLHWNFYLSFCLFSCNGICFDGLKLSASDIIVSQKGSNGDRKLHFFGRGYKYWGSNFYQCSFIFWNYKIIPYQILDEFILIQKNGEQNFRCTLVLLRNRSI